MNNPALSKRKYLMIIEIFKKYRKALDVSKQDLNTRVLKFRLDQLIEEEQFNSYFFPVTQSRGFHLWVDHLKTPIDSQFIEDFGEAMEGAYDNLRLGLTYNKVLPTVIVDIIIRQCRHRASKYKYYTCISETYRKFIKFLKFIYRPLSRKSIGLWDLNTSDKEYEFRLKYETTLDCKALEIYYLGLNEIEQTCRKILSISSKHSSCTKKKTTVIRFLKECGDFIEDGKMKFYSNKNKYSHTVTNIPFYVHRVNDKYSPLAQYMGPSQQQHSAVMIVNTSVKLTAAEIFTLLSHEILPGHHLEVCNNFERWGHSDIWYFTVFTGYIEGWALYSEYISAECEGCVCVKLAQLQMELLRDVRMVIDAGIHSQFCDKWSLSEATEFMRSGKFRRNYIINSFRGMTLSFQEIQSEILRCATRPAYAVAYKIGKIFFLRYSKKAMRSGLSLKKIHDIFLSRRVPLFMMHELFTSDEKSSQENPKVSDNNLTHEILTHMNKTQQKVYLNKFLHCSNH